jgi:hypothetical protein
MPFSRTNKEVSATLFSRRETERALVDKGKVTVV